MFKISLLMMVVALLAACSGGSNTIDRVTALPSPSPTIPATEEPAAAPSDAPTDEPTTAATITNEPTPTPQPTTRLEATIAAATEAGQNTSERSQGRSSFALSTRPPEENRFEPGEARAIALATDVLLAPDDLEQPIAFEENPVSIRFDEFYNGFSLRRGLLLSDKLKSLDGQQVVIEGYVAPPLKPRLDFFVLTRIQLAFCPFCSTDVEWPDDIALIYLPEQLVLSSEFPVRIIGQMEVGSSVDAETGMVSLVRIYAEDIEVIQ
ncbi:MAG: hypothetical protein OHK0046_45620 [Anaerolineae bacterium]